jgi:hypothetical protein
MLLYFLQENPGHDSLAITVCNEILTNPESSSLKLFVRILNQLELSPKNVSNLKEIVVLIEKISKVCFLYYTPTHRVGAILQSSCPFVRPSVHTFVTDISASTGRNDFIFDIWLWHVDVYHVSPFQVYCTSTSCLQCDLEFFMFAVMKTLVTVISASTGRNDFIFDIWLWHGDLYQVSPFQVYRTSTSCLQCDLGFFMFVVMKTFVSYLSFYWKK